MLQGSSQGVNTFPSEICPGTGVSSKGCAKEWGNESLQSQVFARWAWAELTGSFWAALFKEGSRLWFMFCKISIILVGFNIYWRWMLMSWSLPQLFSYHYTLSPSTPFSQPLTPECRNRFHPIQNNKELPRAVTQRGGSGAGPHHFSCDREHSACTQCSREGPGVTTWGCHCWSCDEVPRGTTSLWLTGWLPRTQNLPSAAPNILQEAPASPRQLQSHVMHPSHASDTCCLSPQTWQREVTAAITPSFSPVHCTGCTGFPPLIPVDDLPSLLSCFFCVACAMSLGQCSCVTCHGHSRAPLRPLLCHYQTCERFIMDLPFTVIFFNVFLSSFYSPHKRFWFQKIIYGCGSHRPLILLKNQCTGSCLSPGDLGCFCLSQGSTHKHLKNIFLNSSIKQKFLFLS